MLGEVNLVAEDIGLPLLVVVVKDSILSWEDYAKHFPAPPTTASSRRAMNSFGHFHPLDCVASC